MLWEYYVKARLGIVGIIHSTVRWYIEVGRTCQHDIRNEQLVEVGICVRQTSHDDR